MNTRTTVEILNLSLEKIAEVRNLYPINKREDVLRYSKELSDYGTATFRVSTKDPLFDAVGDILTASLPVGSGFFLRVDTLMTYTNLWQHEIGVDKINGPVIEAIESSFTTNDLGLVAGGPSQPSMVGDNQWLRLERIEPDFVQTGEMDVVVLGRPYAQAEDVESSPYVFEPDTHKIDMKEQRRELRLRFTSNTLGGNYQLGRVLLNADTGDVRGY